MLFWDDIRGHDRVKEVLGRSVIQGRTHHALLMAGPQGVGKRALSLALAATMYCTDRKNVEPFEAACGKCVSCHKMSQSIHPDLIVVEPEGKKRKNIKIGHIREVQRKTSTSPYEAPQHIVLLDDAHLMTEEASNALLKTLEEPGQHLRLILVTDSTHLLLDTILSRCQLVRFGALEASDVQGILRGLVAASDSIEGPVSDELLHTATGFGEGSPGVGFHALSSGMLHEREGLLRQLLELRPDAPLNTLQLAEKLAKQNPLLAEQFDILQAFMRDVMLYKINPSDTDRLINRDLIASIKRLAEVMSVEDALYVIDLVRVARQRYQHYVNPQLILEDLFEHISHYTSASSHRPVLQGRP